MHWTAREEYDGHEGLGEQVSALQVIQGLLVDEVDAPRTGRGSPSPTSTGEAATGEPSGNAASVGFKKNWVSESVVGAWTCCDHEVDRWYHVLN